MSLEISECDCQKRGGSRLLSAFCYGRALKFIHPCTLKITQILNSTATAGRVEALLLSFWKIGCKLVDPHGICMKPIGLVVWPCFLINYFLPLSRALVYYCFMNVGAAGRN